MGSTSVLLIWLAWQRQPTACNRVVQPRVVIAPMTVALPKEYGSSAALVTSFATRDSSLDVDTAVYCRL